MHELAAWLRAAGCSVVEEAGWVSRGHGPMRDLRGIMLHHTAGTYPSDLRAVRDGRPGLRGPLANLYLTPGGTWHVIAAGTAWHAGKGGPWRDIPADGANTRTLGVEVSHPGDTPITAHQYDALIQGVAGLLTGAGMTADRVLLHKEWAPNRKIDIRNDATRVRADVAHALERPDMTPEQAAQLAAVERRVTRYLDARVAEVLALVRALYEKDMGRPPAVPYTYEEGRP